MFNVRRDAGGVRRWGACATHGLVLHNREAKREPRREEGRTRVHWSTSWSYSLRRERNTSLAGASRGLTAGRHACCLAACCLLPAACWLQAWGLYGDIFLRLDKEQSESQKAA